jgi:MIP family channel proteins
MSATAIPAEAPQPRGPAAYVAEIVGTFLLVFFICGFLSIVHPGPHDLAALGLVHAFVLGAAIYALGGTSGAHFNPAVTVALWSIRKIRINDAIVYVVCQLIGAVLAALLVKLLFKDIGAVNDYGVATINKSVLHNGSSGLGLIAEALGTFMLVWAIMGTAVNPRGEAQFAGLVIGTALGVAVMVFGPATGAGLNPARWFGPALISSTYTDGWIYIVGPLAGGLIAALGYRALVLAPRALPAVAPKEELPG